ncbi:Iron(III) dicitrate transport ATP-binding protein fecE [Lachnospiraceae bacterium TWA4]|nr:Iron(III) dicitrate transport ATP-binding protein fecE [Lachnospiraceae bacterium TWA4]
MELKVKNASFAYPSGQVLFNDINFSLNEQTILTILGRNGVGKTTLLKCIMGILHWKTGTLELDGKDIENARLIKEIAYVPQAHQVNFSYSIRDIVTMGRARFMGSLSVPSKKDYEYADEALERVGLADLKNRSCNQLSGGQLQLVYIARALAAKPKILILDEPESHLDFYNQFFILELLEEIVKEQGVSLIINTHYPEHAMQLSDKTLFLRREDYTFGDTNKILNEENIRKYFGVESVVDQINRSNRTIPVFAVTGRTEK